MNKLEEIQTQFAPNLTAHEYRNNTNFLQEHKQLQFLANYGEKSLVVAGSNMCDRIWDGRLWFYKEPQNFERSKYFATMHTESGINCVSYLNQFDKFVVGEDTGKISVIELMYDTDSYETDLRCIGYGCLHDDGVVATATFANGTKIVSGGLDSCLKIWDTTIMMPINSYDQAHRDSITCLDIPKSSTHVIFTSSTDNQVLIWDTRRPKPARGVWCKQDIPLTSVACHKNDENIIAVGGQDGSLAILDVRNIRGEILHECNLFERAVHRLSFSDEDLLAACCDSTEVSVLKMSIELEVVFENNDHEDFVRGLSWIKNELFTCGWDDKVARHVISDKK